MCHSFETYDPKIAIREVEARLTAPAPDFSFVRAWPGAVARLFAGWTAEPAFPRKEAVE